MNASERLLPSYYRTVALFLGLGALLLFFWNLSLTEFLALERAQIQWILKDLMLIALALMAFSKEVREHPKLGSLRAREFKNALLFGVILVIWESIQEIIFWDGTYEVDSGFKILSAVFIYYLVCFNYKKSKFRRGQRKSKDGTLTG